MEHTDRKIYSIKSGIYLAQNQIVYVIQICNGVYFRVSSAASPKSYRALELQK